MNILKDAHKIVLNNMTAMYGTKTHKTVRSRHGVFCPYMVKEDRIRIVSFKDLGEQLSFKTIEFAPIARDSSEYGMSDPFAWIDRKYGVSKAALQQLTMLVEPTTIKITTQSDLIACDEYRAILKELITKGHTVHVQLMTIWGLDSESARILMPAMPSEKRLQKAYEYLIADGIQTTKVSLNGKAA